MPADGLDMLRPYDAIFLGAVGDPRIVPDHVSLWGLLIRIRRGFHQSINVRPARFLPGMRGPLLDPDGFDILVVRENSEGEYSQIGGTIHDPPDDMALQVSVFTRRSVERVVRFAFEAAMRRRRHLVSATKSNGIVHTMPFWDHVVREVAGDYPDVRVESVHLDALLARLVRAPGSLDVMVASNLFGDLLTDLAGALMGSIGMAPGREYRPRAQVSVDVRARARVGTRHRRPGDRQPDRPALDRRPDARTPWAAGAQPTGSSPRSPPSSTMVLARPTWGVGHDARGRRGGAASTATSETGLTERSITRGSPSSASAVVPRCRGPCRGVCLSLPWSLSVADQ